MRANPRRRGVHISHPVKSSHESNKITATLLATARSSSYMRYIVASNHVFVYSACIAISERSDLELSEPLGPCVGAWGLLCGSVGIRKPTPAGVARRWETRVVHITCARPSTCMPFADILPPLRVHLSFSRAVNDEHDCHDQKGHEEFRRRGHPL